MRILITGGLGFIGSHLADWLIEDGHDVWVVDNCSTGDMRNQNKKTKEYFLNTISDIHACAEVFHYSKPDIVIHCAASYKDPFDWRTDIDTNIMGTNNLLAFSNIHNCRFIYFQTSLCYGPPQENFITEGHPISPQNSYAITKTAAERFIQLSGIDFVSFRLANVYGPRNLSGAIPAFYKNFVEDKESIIADTKRDFVYIDDLCKIVMLAVKGMGSGIYNVSTNMGQVPIMQIYKTMAEMIGIENKKYNYVRKNEDDVGSINLDNSRLIEDFGMVPETELKHGLEAAINWYSEHGVGEAFTHLKMKG